MSKSAIGEMLVGGGLIALGVVTGGIGFVGEAAMVGSGISMAASGVMTGIATLLQHTPSQGETLANPVAAWNYIYGKQVKVTGQQVYFCTNSNSGNGNGTSSNKQFHQVRVLACHPCAIGNWQLRIDGKPVPMAPFLTGYMAQNPEQISATITSISRNDNLVTVTVDQEIPNANGTTMFTKNVEDPTYNGIIIVTQPNPEDATTFQFVMGGPNGASSGGTLNTSYPSYGNKVYVEFLNGNHTSTFPTLLTAGTQWGPHDLLLGYTAVYIQLGYDASVFPSYVPNIEFVLDGKDNIFDPRTGGYGLSNNPALCIADYMSLPVIEGGFGLTIGTEIPTAGLIAAGNTCDETVDLNGGGTIPRYTCNGEVKLTKGRGAILADMLTSCAGRITTTGNTYSIFPGVFAAPTLFLSEADLVGPIEWTPRLSVRDTANGVKGTYSNSAANNFETGDFPAYQEDTEHGYATDQYLTQDGGERIYLEMDLGFTSDDPTAQRLAKIAMMRLRYQGRGTLRTTLKGYQAVAVDTVQFTYGRYGWVNKILEVLDVRLVPTRKDDGAVGLHVELDVAECDSSIYDWATSEQVSPQGYSFADNMSGSNTVLPPTNLLLYTGPGGVINGVTYPNTVSKQADGLARNSLYITWTPPNDAFVTSGGSYEVQYQIAGATEWTTVGFYGSSATEARTGNVTDGQQYNARVNCWNVAGYVSEWTEAGPITISDTFSQISSSGLLPNIPFNVSNNAVLGSVVDGTAADIDVYGPGGVGTAWSNITGIGEASYPAATITGLSFATLYYVVYDVATSDYQAITDYNSTLGDNLIFLGYLTTVASSGTGGVTGGGGGTTGGPGGGGPRGVYTPPDGPPNTN